jgi:hypothetical protein
LPALPAFNLKPQTSKSGNHQPQRSEDMDLGAEAFVEVIIDGRVAAFA